MPWKRLVVPFAVYAVIAVVAFSFFGKSNLLGLVVGVAMGGVLYLGITVIMVKFGWNPPAWGAGGQGRPGARRRRRKTGEGAGPGHGGAPAASRPPPARTNAGNPRAKRGR